MGKKRIHELAKELSMSSAELVQRISELNLLQGQKLGASNSIEDSVAEDIRRAVRNAAAPVPQVVRRRKRPEATVEASFLEPLASDQPSDESSRYASPDDMDAGAAAPPVQAQGLAAVQAQGQTAPQSHEPADPRQASLEQTLPVPESTTPSAASSAQDRKPVSIKSKPFDKARIVGTSPVGGPAPGPSSRTADPRGGRRGPAAPPPPPMPNFRPLPPPPPPEPPQAQPGPDAQAQPGALAAQGLQGEQAVPGVQGAEAISVPPTVGGTDAPFTLVPSPGPATAVEAAPAGAEAGAADAASSGPDGQPSDAPVSAASESAADAEREVTPPTPAPRQKITRVLIPDKPRGDAGASDRARVVGVKSNWTASGAPHGDARPRPYTPAGRPGGYPPRPGGPGGAPGGRPGGPPWGRPPAGPRPDAGPPPPESTDGRKRDRKGARRGHGDGEEGAARPGKRREVVERTDIYSEGDWTRGRGRKGKGPKKTHQKTEITVPKASKRRIKVDEAITVSELAHRLSLKSGDIIKRLMGMGVMASVNQSLDFDTASLVAGEFGYEVEKSSFDEGEFFQLPGVDESYEKLVRPPVVTIMGHVDHGKTSLLDYIRKSKIQEGEAGGITQHIGAYHVQVGDRFITFLDTPGHEAFTSMRSRGAQVTDIVVLIVAADDGVMPQTREAADHAKAAGVPIVVAVNKIDKPDAEPDRIRREMAELGLSPEAWGGQTVFCDVSAKTGQGVDELLEMILLQADILNLEARTGGPARGRVIEARLDKGRGAVATVLVGEGTLRQGDSYVCGVHYGRLRALLDDQGMRVESAGPSIPVEIQGISGVPLAGDEFIAMTDEKQARQVSQHRLARQRESTLVKTTRLTLENLFDRVKEGSVKDLNLILKADVQGSLEAIQDSVSRLSTQEIQIHVLHGGVGQPSETDVMLASASSALIICFGVKPSTGRVQELAEAEQVQVRYYDVIYKLLDDIKEAMAGLLDPVKHEVLLGVAEVRAIFDITRVGPVAGSAVTEGKIQRGARARVRRGKNVVYEGKIGTLKRLKNDVREVLEGYECGIGLENFGACEVGDRIECFQVEETAATVELVNQAVERAAEKARAEAASEASKAD